MITDDYPRGRVEYDPEQVSPTIERREAERRQELKDALEGACKRLDERRENERRKHA